MPSADGESQYSVLIDSHRAVPKRLASQAIQTETRKKSDTALLVVGLVAVERFKLLSAT